MGPWIIVAGLVVLLDILIVYAALKTASDEDDRNGM